MTIESGAVLLEAEYKGYKISIDAIAETDEVVVYPPDKDNLYLVYVPLEQAQEMEQNHTINPYLAITLAMIELAINVRKATNDIGRTT